MPSNEGLNSVPANSQVNEDRRAFLAGAAAVSTGLFVAYEASSGYKSNIPTIIKNLEDFGVDTLAGPDIVSARPESLGEFTKLTEEEIFNLYETVGPEDIGPREFGMLVTNLSSCAVCLRGDIKLRQDYIQDLGKMCRSISFLSKQHGVSYSACLTMFYHSGGVTSYEGFASEVNDERTRSAVKRIHRLVSERSLNYLYEKAKERNMFPYELARVLGPGTFGIHDMEIKCLAEALEFDETMYSKFLASYPKEAEAMHKVLVSHNNLESAKSSYMQEVQTVLDSQQVSSLFTPEVIRAVLTNEDTGELNAHQIFKTTFAWAEISRLSTNVLKIDRQFPSKELQETVIEHALEYYTANPQRLFSDQLQSPKFKKLLGGLSSQGHKFLGVLQGINGVEEAVKNVMDVEAESAPIVAKKDMDPGFQAVTGVAYASYKIKAREGYGLLATKFGITAQESPSDYTLATLAMGLREISSVFALCSRAGITVADLPYSSPEDIFGLLISLSKETYEQNEGGELTPSRFNLGRQDIRYLLDKIFAISQKSAEKPNVPQTADLEYLKHSCPPWDSWMVSRLNTFNLWGAGLEDTKNTEGTKTATLQKRRVGS